MNVHYTSSPMAVRIRDKGTMAKWTSYRGQGNQGQQDKRAIGQGDKGTRELGN